MRNSILMLYSTIVNRSNQINNLAILILISVLCQTFEVAHALQNADTGLQLSTTSYPQLPLVQGTKDRVEFIGKDGKITKQILLVNSTEVHEGQTSTWTGKIATIRHTRSLIFNNNKNLGLLQYTSTSYEDYGVTSSTSIFQYFDVAGNIIWEKSGVGNSGSFWSISANGQRVFLVEDENPEPASGLEFFPHKPIVYDDHGNIVWELGSYDWVGRFKLANNGKYGFFEYRERDTENSSLSTEGYKYFNVDKKSIQTYEFTGDNERGVIDVSDDGKVTIYRIKDEILDSTVKPFKVKTTRQILHEFQL